MTVPYDTALNYYYYVRFQADKKIQANKYDLTAISKVCAKTVQCNNNIVFHF